MNAGWLRDVEDLGNENGVMLIVKCSQLHNAASSLHSVLSHVSGALLMYCLGFFFSSTVTSFYSGS